MIVVADTSILINLCRVGHGHLLRLLFHDLVIPPEVASEFARLACATPRFAGLTLPEGIRCQAVTVIPALLRSAGGLDAGETAALALAVEIHADAVLVDERRGHEVAIQLGLRTVGILEPVPKLAFLNLGQRRGSGAGALGKLFTFGH